MKSIFRRTIFSSLAAIMIATPALADNLHLQMRKHQETFLRQKMDGKPMAQIGQVMRVINNTFDFITGMQGAPDEAKAAWENAAAKIIELANTSRADFEALDRLTQEKGTLIKIVPAKTAQLPDPEQPYVLVRRADDDYARMIKSVLASKGRPLGRLAALQSRIS